MSVLVFQVPEEMQDKEFAVILQDEPQQPLALLPLTEEEQVRHTALGIRHGRGGYIFANSKNKKGSSC